MNRPARLMMLSTLLAVSAGAYSQPPGGGILRLDTDGDGRVSREEFQSGERGGPGRGLAQADSDGDGAVSRDEVQAMLKDETRKREGRMLGAFDAMDSDGNGVVTREEMVEGAFSRIDGDGDGYVTEEEARAMHERRGKRGKGAPPPWDGEN